MGDGSYRRVNCKLPVTECDNGYSNLLFDYVAVSFMTYQRQSSYESFCSLLSCKSKDFEAFSKGQYTTAELVSDVQKNLLDRYQKDLDIDQRQISPYKLLIAMLKHAPAESGKRYVAAVLLIAATKGLDAVREVADTWVERMFLRSE